MYGNERLTRNGLYPIVDRQPLVRLVGESVTCIPSVGMYSSKYKARWTGEKRRPRKGEWYLSGSRIECYYAPNDLGSEYHIAEVCEVVEIKTVTVKRTF